MNVKCSNGIEYSSIRDFCRKTGNPKTSVLRAIRKNGFFERDGLELRIADEFEVKKEVRNEVENHDSVIKKLTERFTEEELKLLSNGEGLRDKSISYPKIELSGKKHKFLVISDGHLGSKYSPVEFHYKAFEEARKQKCEAILHVGDMVEGLTPRRISTQIYELTHIGYKAQRDLAIDVFKKAGLPIYAISGNHDAYFNEFAGANIVEDICYNVPNMNYLGHNQADIEVDGCIVRLFHGIDGNSYSLSYRLQKLVDSFSGGKKPHILLAGHVHKYCHIFERNVNAVSIPSLQMQSGFMQAKKIAAHVGFTIIEFETNSSGISNFNVKLYPFYE